MSNDICMSFNVVKDALKKSFGIIKCKVNL